MTDYKASISQNDAGTILAAGQAISQPRSPIENGINQADGVPYVVVPEGCRVEDLERLLPTPIRHRATVTVTDSASFISYVALHGSKESTCIYADIDSEDNRMAMVAVVNDNGTDEPGWRDHRCTFEQRLSVEWKRWTGKNKAAMSQAEFATWLEENMQDVATLEGMPTGADMLALALGFERTADKRLKSKINLQSGGVRLEYVDDEDKDTSTSLSVFERFTLGLSVFDGSASAYPLEARLKYRERDGRVTFWFELIRPDRVFKTAVVEELDRIKDATGFLLINGTP